MDRNSSLSFPYQLWQVALRKESVDRNSSLSFPYQLWQVALRKESVDRNMTCPLRGTVSHSRSPQGERG